MMQTQNREFHSSVSSTLSKLSFQHFQGCPLSHFVPSSAQHPLQIGALCPSPCDLTFNPVLVSYLFIYLTILIECLFCAKHSSRAWRYKKKKNLEAQNNFAPSVLLPTRNCGFSPEFKEILLSGGCLQGQLCILICQVLQQMSIPSQKGKL